MIQPRVVGQKRLPHGAVLGKVPSSQPGGAQPAPRHGAEVGKGFLLRGMQVPWLACNTNSCIVKPGLVPHRWLLPKLLGWAHAPVKKKQKNKILWLGTQPRMRHRSASHAEVEKGLKTMRGSVLLHQQPCQEESGGRASLCAAGGPLLGSLLGFGSWGLLSSSWAPCERPVLGNGGFGGLRGGWVSPRRCSG